MSGSNALTIARDPAVQINPLAAVTAGTQAASSVYDLRQKQATEAAGQAYQGAINQQTGEFDPNEFRRRLAASGPAAMAAGAALLNTQNISSDQLDQNLKKAKWLNAASGAALQSGDFSDAGMMRLFQGGMASGLFTLPEVQRQLAQLPPDAAGRQRWLQEHQDTSASFQEQMNQRFGTPFRENVGGQIVGGVQNQRGGGGLSTGGGAINTTLTPEGAVGLPSFTYTNPATGKPVTVPGMDAIKIFGYGVLLPPNAQGHVDLPPGWQQVSGGGGVGGGGGVVGADGKPVSGANPPHLNVPGQPQAPAAPGGYQGTGTGTAADTVPIYQPPAGTPPAAPAASQPPGPRSSLEGGVPVASANALQVPTVGAAGPPSPLVPGDVDAIIAGMNRGRATPASGTQTAAAFSFGPSAEETQGFKTSADKLAADDLAATEWQSTKLPYVEALKNYGEGTKTGPGTDFWNQFAGTIRTPMAKIGIDIGPLTDTTKRVDELGKWLATIQSSNPVSAKSDAELAQVLKGSASTHINEVAGEDMVKAGFTLRRMGYALNQDWHNNPALQQQYGTYLRYLGDMNNKIDPRAFSIDMLNPSQKQRLVAAIKNGSDADAERFESSLALARRSRQVP